jgi:molecular chaperone GrpE
MDPNRKSHDPGFAPGEPEAPVAAPQAAPAPSGANARHAPDVPGANGQAAAADDGQAAAEGTPEELDLEEIAAKAEQADRYLELAQRTKADFENYRKRAARETAAAQERGVAKLARELLPAVDNLDRAVEAIETQSEDGSVNLVSGIRLVHADVVAALSRAGIERFSPKGEQFDPQRHEAIAQRPVEGVEPGTIVEVYQRGYVLGEFVIRPARVVVAG